MLQRIPGRDVRLVTPAMRLRPRAAHARAAGWKPTTGEGTYDFLCTGDVSSFREHGSRFLQMPLGEVEHVDFEAPSTATL